MRWLAGLSLRNRALIALLSIVASTFGALAFASMRQDLIPATTSPTLAILSSDEGATPDVVDADVSSVVETAVESVDGLVSTTTSSGTGLSLVTATFRLGLDIGEVEQKVSKALRAADGLLPEGVEPRIITGSVDDFPILQAAVSSEDGTDLSSTLRDAIIRRVEAIGGVREARFNGARDDEMRVTMIKTESDRTGVDSAMLAATIAAGLRIEDAGSLTEGDDTLSIRSGQAGSTVDEVGAIVVSAPKTGEVLTVDDLADVEIVPDEAATLSRIDGQAALVLSVEKIPSANTVAVTSAVRDELADVGQEYDLDSTVVFDQSPYISHSIEALSVEGLIGLACAVVVVLVFLGSLRVTSVTAVSIPLSLLIAGVGMAGAQFSLNMLTLGALTVAIGRVVDDSIVVIESIERAMVTIEDRVDAILAGVSTVAGAVVASTITTVAIFIPVAFITGTIGELFRPFAVTAAIAMLASLVVSLTIIPVLAFWFVHPRIRASDEHPSLEARLRERLETGYRPVIEWTIGRPWRVMSGALAVLAATALLVPGISTGYLGTLGETDIRILQKLSPSTTLAAGAESADVVEDQLDRVDGVARVQTTIGSSGNALEDASLGGGGGLTSFLVSTDDDADQNAVMDEIRDRLDDLPERDDLGDLSYSIVSEISFASDIELSITALDDESLASATTAVRDEVDQLDVVSDTESSLASRVDLVDVRIDADEALRYGLTETDIRAIVHSQTTPSDAGTMVIDGQSTGVQVYPGSGIANASDLESISIDTPTSGTVPLSTFATIVRTDGPIVVQSQQGLRSSTISVHSQSDDLGATSTAIDEAISDLDLPDGATATLGGVASERVDAFGQLGVAGLIAVLIVYTVMVATFRSLLQPLILLISVPFAATGAVAIQRLTGEAVAVPSLIGALMLVGIVVTNSIVLVDLVNQRRRDGLDLHSAIVDGATRRLRPILMTAIATIAALVPMALGITGGGAFISRPLALVVIGGLLSSTILTLVVLPALYSLVEEARSRLADRRARVPRTRAAVSTSGRPARESGHSVRRPSGSFPGTDAHNLLLPDVDDRFAVDLSIDPDLERTRIMPRHAQPSSFDEQMNGADHAPLIAHHPDYRGRREVSDAATPPPAQYLAFSRSEERTPSATVSSWWASLPSGRRPLLLLDRFSPSTPHGVALARPTDRIDVGGRPLSATTTALIRALVSVLDESVHGYGYYAAQLVLWEIVAPDDTRSLDVSVPEPDAPVVRDEFQSLYRRMLRARDDSDGMLWVVTPTSPDDPRMLLADVR